VVGFVLGEEVGEGAHRAQLSHRGDASVTPVRHRVQFFFLSFLSYLLKNNIRDNPSPQSSITIPFEPYYP
jgi:hypothetical protein